MKRFSLLFCALLLVCDMLRANPVTQSSAKAFALRFAAANFEFSLQGDTLEMVYLTDHFFVFNIGDEGFVIISSDNRFRPVVGYSDEGAFNPHDIPPALADYFEGLCEARNMALGRGVTSNAEAKADWDQLLLDGKLVSRNGGRSANYLLTTKWNQDYPYNCLCPDDPAGPGGHAYVGCLATAMCQLTRYWAYPVHGNGSHCYTHETYGQICADFEHTRYDWEHMPDVLSANASEEEKLAVGTIGFHCGVPLDMGYGPDGSGGPSDPIPSVMHQYFSYTEHNVKRNRNDYDLETWKDMVKEQFDMGWPMYYGGCDGGGCHAFNCDGYDDYDLFHFNLGWGGSSNGWYIIDEAPFTHPADAMFNFVPEPVYDATPMAVADFTVVPAGEEGLSAVLSWTNPTENLGGAALTHIDQIIVKRNNVVVYTENDASPGARLTFTDMSVPYYDCFDYKVQVVVDGRPGKVAVVKKVAFGPACAWMVMAGTTSFQGWRGARITVRNACGTPMETITMENSSTQNLVVNVPVGRVCFDWTAPTAPIANLFFLVKDADNNTLFSFNGSSDDLAEGTFLEVNNGCGDTDLCEQPSDLQTQLRQGEVHLSWTGNGYPDYGYLVYRDGQICRLVQDGMEYVDSVADLGGHCYQVSSLCRNGETEKSNESCVSVGECHPPRYFDFEPMGSANRPMLTWVRPNPSEGLSGYALYRSNEPNDGYQRIKLLGQNATSYQDNALTMEDDYYYRLYAVYQALDCTSSPAAYKYDDNQFYLHVYYSPTETDENPAEEERLYPNPTCGRFVVHCHGLQHVVVLDMLGQKVADSTASSLDLSAVDTGIYFVRIVTDHGESVHRISVVR